MSPSVGHLTVMRPLRQCVEEEPLVLNPDTTQLQSAGANDDFDVQSTDWLQTHEDPAITWSTTHLASHFDFPMPIWPCNVCFMHDPLFYNRCK